MPSIRVSAPTTNYSFPTKRRGTLTQASKVLLLKLFPVYHVGFNLALNPSMIYTIVVKIFQKCKGVNSCKNQLNRIIVNPISKYMYFTLQQISNKTGRSRISKTSCLKYGFKVGS